MHFAFFVFHFVIDRMRKQLLMSILDVIHIFFALFRCIQSCSRSANVRFLKYLVQAIIDAVHNIFLDRLCHNGSSSFPIAGLRLQMVRTFQSFHDLGNRNLVCRIIQQIPTLGPLTLLTILALRRLANTCSRYCGDIWLRSAMLPSDTCVSREYMARSIRAVTPYLHFWKISSLLYCLKCFVQILDDIVDIFRTDGKTDGIRFDTLIQKFLFCTLAVSCGCRVDHQ